MSRRALKVVVELKFRAVSCPGVRILDKDDIYLSMCFMGQYRQSEWLPAVFPLLFNEKMTFEKIFRNAVDPGDIAIMLEYETVRIELVQVIPSVADTLACFEEDARRFLFPEPKLVPSFSGVDREVLMTRAPHFAGIAPRLEFSTKTTIIECSAQAQTNIYPNVFLRPVMRGNRKPSSRPRTSSPQRIQPQTLGRRPGDKAYKEKHGSPSPSHIPRSWSLSPMRSGNAQHLPRAKRDRTNIPPPTRSSWPGFSRSASPHRSALFTNPSTPLTRSSSTVTFSPTDRRIPQSNSLRDGGRLEDDSSSSDDPHDYGLWEPSREQARSRSSSHRQWEAVEERVRGLLTTPKAVRRLVYGATHSEVDEVLARRSISPGPLL